MSPQPRRGDIRPPEIRLMIASSTAINLSAFAFAGLSRLPHVPDAAPTGAEDNPGPDLIPRLRHGLQDAAAAAA
jgi:hypothetical protein